MTKVLFVTYGGGHVNMLLPLLSLCDESDIEFELLALTGAKPKAEQSGFAALGYDDIVAPADRVRYQDAGLPLLAANHNPLSGISQSETLTYLGVNWVENLAQYGETLTESIYERVGRHSFLPVKFFEETIKTRGYGLVVATNSPKSERAALIAAENLGVPRIRVEDLFFDDNLQGELMERLGPDFSLTIGRCVASPTKICVCSDYTKALYSSKQRTMLLGTEIADVVVTGQPAFDQLTQLPKHTKLSFEQQIDPTRRLVLWSHQNETPDGHETLELIGSSAEAIYAMRCQLVVKFHPDASKEEMRRVVSRFSNNQIAPILAANDENIVALLHRADIVIAQESTTMLEAFLIGKPTVCIDPLGMRTSIPYVDMGVSKRVENETELLAALENEMESDPSMLQELKRIMGFKEAASGNILAVIRSLL